MNCDTLSVPLGTHTRKHLDLLNNYQLFQLIDEPTRITENSETCVDHFITNKKENVINSGVYPLSISDHSFIYAIRKISIPRANLRVIEPRNFKSFDESAFILDLKNADWPTVTAATDANDFWAMWKDRFLHIIDKHAPRRTIKVHK